MRTEGCWKNLHILFFQYFFTVWSDHTTGRECQWIRAHHRNCGYSLNLPYHPPWRPSQENVWRNRRPGNPHTWKIRIEIKIIDLHLKSCIKGGNHKTTLQEKTLYKGPAQCTQIRQCDSSQSYWSIPKGWRFLLLIPKTIFPTCQSQRSSIPTRILTSNHNLQGYPQK